VFEIGSVLWGAAAPALAVRVLRGALHRRVTAGEQQGIGRTDFGSNQAEIGSRVEETGIPTIPCRKDLLDPFTKRH